MDLVPSAPKTNDILIVNVSAEPDADDQFKYEWHVNGQLVRSITTASLTDALDLSQPGLGSKGDHVGVLVTPFDPNGIGNPVIATSLVANTAPIPANDVFTVHQGQSAAFTPLTNDRDADGDTLQAFLEVDGVMLASYTWGNFEHGSGYTDSAGNFYFTPTAGYAGDQTIGYWAYDGAEYVYGTMTIAITNAAPIVVADEFQVHQGQSAAFTPLANDSDADSDTLQAFLEVDGVMLPTYTWGYFEHGSGYTDTAGNFYFTPTAGYVGEQTIGYWAYDGAEYVFASLTIDITNAAPLVVPDEFQVHQGQSAVFTPLGNDSDADGDTLQAFLEIDGVMLPTYTWGYFEHGSGYFDSGGNLYYQSAVGFTGIEELSYRIFDGAEYSAPATIAIRVSKTAEDLLADYEAAIIQANQAYTDAVNGNDDTRDIDQDLNDGEYYGDLDELYETYEYAVAAAEATYLSAHESADAIYQAGVTQAQTALDASTQLAENTYLTAIAAAEDAWSQTTQDAASAHDAAVLAAGAAYQATLTPYQSARDAAQIFAAEHPEDPEAQAALAQAEQALSDAEAQAAADLAAAKAAALTLRTAAEEQAELTYASAADAAQTALDDELATAQQAFDAAGELAWSEFQPLEDAALAARTAAEQLAWDAYQALLPQLETEWQADESAAESAFATARAAALAAWHAAEQAAWDDYATELGWQNLTPDAAIRPSAPPGWSDDSPVSDEDFGELVDDYDPANLPPFSDDAALTYVPFDWDEYAQPVVTELYVSAEEPEPGGEGDDPNDPEILVDPENWRVPSSPYYARSLDEAKYRAWLAAAAQGATSETAVGASVAAEFFVSEELTWSQFFSSADYDQFRAQRREAAHTLDPVVLSALDAEWQRARLLTGYSYLSAIGEEVATRWTRVSGFEWTTPETGWQELFTYQASDRLHELRSRPFPEIAVNDAGSILRQDNHPSLRNGPIYLQFTRYYVDPNGGDLSNPAQYELPQLESTANANRNFYADQVRDHLVPRLRYATVRELTDFLGALTNRERNMWRLALDLEMARSTEQLANANTDAATRRQAAESLGVCRTVYAEMHYAGDASRYGLHGNMPAFAVIMANFRATAEGQPMLDWRNYRGTHAQRVAFLADTTYETYLLRERYLIDMRYGFAPPQGSEAHVNKEIALRNLPSAFQFYLARNMVLFQASAYEYVDGDLFRNGNNLFRRTFDDACISLYNGYFAGGALSTTHAASAPLFYSIDHFNLENMALKLVVGWQELLQSDPQGNKLFFANALHPMERSALINALGMAELTFTRSGSNGLADAARQMREFLTTELNRQLDVVAADAQLARIFQCAQTVARFLPPPAEEGNALEQRRRLEGIHRVGVRQDELAALTAAAPQVRRIADARATSAYADYLRLNPFRVTHQPAFVWEFVDRTVLNAAEMLSPVLRTGQRLAGRTTDVWGDLDAMREIMRGNYNVTLGPTRLNTGLLATLGDAALTIATVTPIGGVMTPARHLMVMAGSTVAASFAMAAVEVAPVNEQWRAPLRFAAGLAAGIRGGSVANSAVTAARTRMPLLAARTIDMARAHAALAENQVAMMARRMLGMPITTEMLRTQIWLTTEITAIRQHIGRLRDLYETQSLQTLENSYRDALNNQAAWEARANAPGLSPSQRAALRNSTDFQRARTLANEAASRVEVAYRSIDNAAQAVDVVMDLMRGGSSDGAPRVISRYDINRLAQAIEGQSGGRVTVKPFSEAPMEIALQIDHVAFVRQGNGGIIYVREGRPLSAFWHEFEHYRHWREMLATDPTGAAYWRLPQIQKEERVFRAMFENETVWRLMTPAERQAQIDSLTRYLYELTAPGTEVRLRLQQLLVEAQARVGNDVVPTFPWR